MTFISNERFRWLGTAAAFAATASIASPALAASQHLGQRTLREGMSGHDVRVLQSYLTICGFNTPVVGVFGPLTEQNVIGFEKRYHLTPNGIVNAKFVKKLRALVAAKTSTGSTTPSSSATTSTSTTGGSSTTTTGTTATGTDGTAVGDGGAGFGPGPNDAPVEKATLVNGIAVAPPDAPAAIREVIAAANKIAFKPYIYGGGHGTWNDVGYDCSGSVSFALHGAGLLSQTEDSTEFESYGLAGTGRWISIYATGGHAYANIAGLWFDTVAQSSSNGNDRWSTVRVSPAAGFIVRHPKGW